MSAQRPPPNPSDGKEQTADHANDGVWDDPLLFAAMSDAPPPKHDHVENDHQCPPSYDRAVSGIYAPPIMPVVVTTHDRHRPPRSCCCCSADPNANKLSLLFWLMLGTLSFVAAMTMGAVLCGVLGYLPAYQYRVDAIKDYCLVLNHKTFMKTCDCGRNCVYNCYGGKIKLLNNRQGQGWSENLVTRDFSIEIDVQLHKLYPIGSYTWCYFNRYNPDNVRITLPIAKGFLAGSLILGALGAMGLITFAVGYCWRIKFTKRFFGLHPSAPMPLEEVNKAILFLVIGSAISILATVLCLALGYIPAADIDRYNEGRDDASSKQPRDTKGLLAGWLILASVTVVIVATLVKCAVKRRKLMVQLQESCENQR